jgi:hypothetical protein
MFESFGQCASRALRVLRDAVISDTEYGVVSEHWLRCLSSAKHLRNSSIALQKARIRPHCDSDKDGHDGIMIWVKLIKKQGRVRVPASYSI